MKKKRFYYTVPTVAALSLQESGIICQSETGFSAELGNISGNSVSDASESWIL